MGLGRGILFCVLVAGVTCAAVKAQTAGGLLPADYQRMRTVAQAEISPDGKFVAYTILRYDRPGRPWPQLWVMEVASGKSTRIWR